MDATLLLESLRLRGARLELRPGGRLAVEAADHDELSDQDVEAIRRHKAELIGLLTSPPTIDPYVFEERAAIMEYDGGLPRAVAERRAFIEVYGALGVASTFDRPSGPTRPTG
jgi:hypothetical protein